jgi:trigger factor
LDVKDESGEVLHHNHGFVCAIDTNRIDLFTIDNLIKELKGKKKGDSIDIAHEVADPFEAKEELAGKKVTLHVEIDTVKRLVEPEFNEDFIKNLGFQSEEDYRDTLKKMLENEFERLTKEQLKTQIYDFLDEQVETDLPVDTIERHAEYLVNTKLMELIRSGIPPQEAESKKEEFKKDSESEARKDIKVGFALNKIADKEKVLVTEREVSQRIVQLASQRGTAPETLKEELEKNHELSALRNQIKEEKTIDLLIKKAKIEEVESKEEDKA